ncbi:MAG: DUF2975 domain-containing protein [Nocardioidaceae bacterium]
MPSQSPSGAVRTGYVLVSGLLFLTIAFGVLALASVAVGLARHGDSILYGETLRVPLQMSPDDFGPLPAGLTVDTWPTVDIEIHHPTSAQMLLRSAMDFGPLVLIGAGLWLLRGFMRSVMDGDPFGSANVRRLRGLGFILVLGAPLVELLNYSLRSSVFNVLPEYPSLHLGYSGYTLPGSALLAGLGAFILAEVFAYGVRLREDVEGTI